jgi:hypothetical protein
LDESTYSRRAFGEATAAGRVERIQPWPSIRGEQWIQRAWTHLKSVSAQLLQQPPPEDWPLASVMEDVDLPECELYFPRDWVGHDNLVQTSDARTEDSALLRRRTCIIVDCRLRPS